MNRDEQFHKSLAEIPPQELIEKAHDMISELAKSGGKSFRMCIPPSRFDTDMLLGEVVRRYESSLRSEPSTWVNVEAERLEWSLKTFTEATSISSLRKCESEIKEIEQDILMNQKNPEEYADAMMCLLDSAGRQGITLQDIFTFYVDKIEINKSRTWKKNPDNSYSHVKPTPPNE